jgi:hypothetical protein
MLSGITEMPRIQPLTLNNSEFSDKNTADFIMHEYGIVDEYYQSNNREFSFFGISIDDYFYYDSWSLEPYNNVISQYVMNNIDPQNSTGNVVIFNIDNPAQNSIAKINSQYVSNPSIIAKTIGENGGFILLGSGAFYENVSDNHQLLRNCADALMNCSFFPSGINPPDLVKPQNLSVSCYPNPFKSSTEFTFLTAEPTVIKVEIFNVKGKKIYSKDNIQSKQGKNSFTWNVHNNSGKTLPSGVYFCKISSPVQSETRKIILIK